MARNRASVSTPASRRIEGMIKRYRETGKIGAVTPKDLAHAKRIATAAASAEHASAERRARGE